MAFYTYDTKADWDNLYEIGAEGAWGHPNTRQEVQLNYHRYVVLPQQRSEMTQIKNILGWDRNTRVIVYHCGFGWMMEVLQNELGLASVTGIQQSTYIQTNKNLNEDTDLLAAISSVGIPTNVGDGLTLFTTFRNGGNPRSTKAADVQDEDLSTSASRNRVRDRAGGPGAEILTYQILSSLEDAEITTLLSRLGSLTNGRITHFVYANAGGSFNNKTLQEWKNFVGNNTVIDVTTFQVL
jgi:hypothetical protein